MSTSTTESSHNGVNMDAVVDRLQDEATVGYKPTQPLEAMWGSGVMPTVTLRRDIEFMMIHPIVMTSLDYYRSGITNAEFWGGPDHDNPQNTMGKPISLDPRVAKFVQTHVEHFWRYGVPVLQEGGYPYGWAAGEHVYRESEGMLMWAYLKSVHPNDAHILTLNYRPVGVRIKNIRAKQPVDLHLASESIPAKGCWYPHKPRFDQFYGRSQLLGAWLPWRRLGWRDGVEQVIDAAIYRAGYRGPIVRHPPEDMQTAQEGIPGTRQDGRGAPRRSARDVARQIVEWAKAGAGFTLSSAQYPPTQGGGKKWDVEFPDHVMDVRPLVESAHYLEDQIMLGVGVPPELIRAGGVGSGYSGRTVPREAFMEGQQRIADAILQMFVTQVVKPLVLWNFGDILFEISAKPLLQTQSENKLGMEGAGAGPQPAGGAAGGGDNANKNFRRSQAAKDSWKKRKAANPTIGASHRPKSQVGPSVVPQPGAARAFSIDPAERDRVLEIIRRVLQKAG